VADRVALVTGANTGIGLAIAERFLAGGWKLGYATQDNEEKHEGPLVELRKRYGDERVHWAWGNIADPAAPERLVAETVQAFGRLDALVNNAGLSIAKPFLELTVADFDLVFDVGVRGSFLAAQAAALRIREQGGGSIVNITSVHEHIPRPAFSVYAAAKAALGMLSRSLALELAEYRIRVNSVAPGVIATPRNEADAERLDPEVPLGRPGRPAEVAALVAWLCSEDATYVTGSSYVIDGGMMQQVVGIPA
jgi:NAD(P)-dependent dehydrogenase (short-subunit alcohol dehydrogenase family)